MDIRNFRQSDSRSVWRRWIKKEVWDFVRTLKSILTGNASKITYLFIPIFMTMSWILLCFMTDRGQNLTLEERLAESYLQKYYEDQVFRDGLLEMMEEENVSLPEGERIHIALTMPFIDQNPVIGSDYIKSIEWIVAYATVPITFHILTNEASTSYVDVIMEKVETDSKSNFRHEILTLETLIKESTERICPRFAASEPFCDLLMGTLTPLLFPQLFPNLEHIIYMDKSITVQDDIGMLYNVIRKMKKEKHAFAMAHEQSSRYLRAFGTWQRRNPSTKLGRKLSDGGKPGFNSDLIVMDLEKLRSSVSFKKLLNERKISNLITTYSYHSRTNEPDLADILNLLAADSDYLFLPLHCQWNRRSSVSVDIVDKQFDVCKVKNRIRAWNGQPNSKKMEEDTFHKNGISYVKK